MSGTTWDDIQRWYLTIKELPPLPAQVKLTAQQFDDLRHNTVGEYTGNPGLLDIPIVLVATVEESTPWQLDRERLEHEAAYRAALAGNRPAGLIW